MADLVVERHVEASPDALYALVSDVTRMGDWSPETTSCRWLGGSIGPTAGARFRGNNRKGWRRWSTTCTVVEATPGKRFAFDVVVAGVPIAHWAYEFTAEGGGCRVAESWEDRRPMVMRRVDPLVMGIPDRVAHNRANIERTLEALDRAASVAGGARPAHP